MIGKFSTDSFKTTKLIYDLIFESRDNKYLDISM